MKDRKEERQRGGKLERRKEIKEEGSFRGGKV